MSRALRPSSLTTLVAANMSACGNSGSNSSASASISGVMTGSYLEHTKICIDANNNGKHDPSEASTCTDVDGAYSLSGTGAITVGIDTDASRNDLDKGVHMAITQPLAFRAPADANAVASAISTELAVLMSSNGGNIGATKMVLAACLGVTINKLLEDHSKKADADTKITLQAEISRAIDLIAGVVTNSDGVDKRPHDGVTKRMALVNSIKTIVIIYAENRDFDNLCGPFPGTSNIPGMNPISTGTAVA